MKKIRKVLIANRGEIAVRIIRACREAGISSLAVYSAADTASMAVREADEAVCIGPAPADRSYLFVPALMAAARAKGADAVHPGYGFLSENADFADICRDQGLVFIGPSGKAIRQMGDKSRARELMTAAGVPVIPGSPGMISSEKEALEAAAAIGYPILIKAAAGGGGRGMRLAENPEGLRKGIREAAEEAKKAFGFGGIYLEKFFTKVHHVEIQIMADSLGHVISLGERDCSSQRRHQKLIEESPSPLMDETLRKAMSEAARKAALAVNYCGAGTIEFIVDENRNFYFMEMNTRIQVEHPVTEMVTGSDLIRTMLDIAGGGELPWKEDLTPQGWALECRINAEDPYRGFAPSPGRLSVYQPPKGKGIRIDSAMEEGAVISPFYDSMIAKLIVHADTRSKAIQKMLRALGKFDIQGVRTTIPALEKILSCEVFQAGKMDTGYVEQHLDEILKDG